MPRRPPPPPPPPEPPVSLFKSLLLRIPLYGRVLLSATALLGVFVLGFYGIARFGGSTIQGPPDTKPFRWLGGPVLLEATNRHHSTTCDITPANGTQRRISLAGTDNPGSHSIKLQPWFSGPATTTCTDSVMAYAGSQIKRREFSESWRFRHLAPVVVAAPLALLVLIAILRARYSE